MIKTIAIPARLIKENLTDEERDELANYGDQLMTDSEIAEFQSNESAWQDGESQRLWQQYQSQAQTLLDKSDIVGMRCFKVGVAFPAEWLAYVTALRAIIKATTGDATAPFPIQPQYPVGS